ncbi:hypothetical protein ANN_23084 [Periplaneta americana]|uniref:Thioredoxin domain-containing protein n=1 Tax=Periplaneta americana TaxID=6978 RepID=A0ABQ8SLC5_PERAM|nr:hypothetical protein ANN_23084 [Periplaneta americana]
MLAPIFDEAADKVAAEFPEAGQVVMGKVDCDRENSVATRFHITKYPTLKVIRNGQPTKREYRGQRSSEAFLSFIQKQLADPIKEFQDLKELKDLDDKKRTVIGYFDRKDVPEYNIFRRVATNLKEDCQFFVGFGKIIDLDSHIKLFTTFDLTLRKSRMYRVFDKSRIIGAASAQMHPPGQPIVVFRADKARSNEQDETFMGNLNVYDELNVWVSEKCVPLVREITFENAEELTEEGLPFLILFHKPDDNESVKKFNDVVINELLSEKQNINFLTADGVKFAHPLHHLGKSQGDLPLIAIDSFRHMYLFPDISEMEVPGKLKAFLQDLYSGKLHREFHYGPEPVTNTPKQIDGSNKKPTTPPESTFKKLAPSKNRYTLLRDEL